MSGSAGDAGAGPGPVAAPRPLGGEEAAGLLPAQVSKPEVFVHRLLDPDALAAAAGGPADAGVPGAGGGVVVVPRLDPATWDALSAAGVAAVVAPAGQAEAVDALALTGEGAPALWLVADSRLALARLSARLNPRPPRVMPGVHPTAVVDPSARLGEGVSIGPLAVIGAEVELGDGVSVGAGAMVGAGTKVGAGSQLHERVVLYDGVTLGRRCLIMAGAVIGGDGFGFAPGPRGAERIHHLGTVVLGDDVEVGANSCIDRATLGSSRVGDRSKLDKLVYLAHNVRLGSDAFIAGHSAVAGSTTIGDRAIFGGAVGVADHLRLGDDVRVAGGAGVTKHMPSGAVWGGMPAQDIKRWRRERYLIGRLEAIWAFVRGRP